MKLFLYAASLMMLLACVNAANFAQDVRSTKQAEQNEKQKAEAEKAEKEAAAEGEKEGTENLWSAEDFKAFVKVGLKMTWKHVGPETDTKTNKKKQENVTYKVSELDDDDVTCTIGGDEAKNAGDGIVFAAEWSESWEDARNGIFELPVQFDQKLESEEAKLKVAGKTYDCIVYSYPMPDSGKYKWWVCKDLPGVVLRYENLSRAEEKGKVNDACIIEYYELTALDIPRESIKPSKKKKKK